MSWGDIAFEADLATSVFGDLVGAPALYVGDVELGKSTSGHAVDDGSRVSHRLRRPKQHRICLGRAERLGRGSPVEHSTRAVVELRNDRIELVLGEHRHVGILMQVLA